MSLPFAIVDYRLPKEAILHLQRYADVFLFNASDITFDAVSGHPDIFMCQVDNQLVVAPNTPQRCIDFLIEKRVNFSFGKREVGFDVNSSTLYNCLVTSKLLLHKRGFTDDVILQLGTTKRFINLSQPFARCSLFEFGNGNFITSDRGIYKELISNKLNALFICADEILLPPYKNGFIGGCLGILDNKIFLSGSIEYINEGEKLLSFCNTNGYELVELYNGALLDVGGIFMLNLKT